MQLTNQRCPRCGGRMLVESDRDIGFNEPYLKCLACAFTKYRRGIRAVKPEGRGGSAYHGKMRLA